jgi:hypothetical protein
MFSNVKINANPNGLFRVEAFEIDPSLVDAGVFVRQESFGHAIIIN